MQIRRSGDTSWTQATLTTTASTWEVRAYGAVQVVVQAPGLGPERHAEALALLARTAKTRGLELRMCAGCLRFGPLDGDSQGGCMLAGLAGGLLPADAGCGEHTVSLSWPGRIERLPAAREALRALDPKPGRLWAYEGALVGMAVGDALGFPGEFIPKAQLTRELGPQGITDFLPPRRKGEPAPDGRGRVSDDTLTAISVAQALLAAGDEPLDQLMEEVSHQLLTWRRIPEGPRGASSSLLIGCDNLARGVGWSMSGVAENEGFGSAVRAIPVALYLRGDRDRLLRTARATSLPTHRHLEAAEAAAAAALLVELALDKASPDQMLAELRVHCTDLKRTPGLTAKLQRLEEVQDLPPEQALSEEGLGEGWTAGEAIAQALYCVRRAPDSFEEAVRLAVNGDGDSNSIGALVGAVMGAWHGLDAIPAGWRDEVERGVPLRQLAGGLHAAWRRRG